MNKFNGEDWILFDTINSPIHEKSITTIFEDISGNVWLGSIHNGIGVFKNDCIVSGSTNLLSGLNKISIFPNPFEDEINLIPNIEQSGLHSFRLYDSRGRQIEAKKNIHLSNGGWKKDLSYLSSGIYFYQISDKDNVTVKGKLIKH